MKVLSTSIYKNSVYENVQSGCQICGFTNPSLRLANHFTKLRITDFYKQYWQVNILSLQLAKTVTRLKPYYYTYTLFQ